MLIGYAQIHKTYKLLDFETGGVTVSRDVVFHELSTAALSMGDDSWNNKKNLLQLEIKPEK